MKMTQMDDKKVYTLGERILYTLGQRQEFKFVITVVGTYLFGKDNTYVGWSRHQSCYRSVIGHPRI